MRLIDADKIPVIFEPVAYSNDCPVALDRETVEELVKHCSVDAVPVVRCKDCKYWIREKAEAGAAGTYCGEIDGMIKPGPDDFCSRGRRKE